MSEQFNQGEMEAQWGEAEKRMGREMYESQVNMQKVSVESARAHIEQDKLRMDLMKNEDARCEARLLIFKKSVDAGLIATGAIVLPIVVGLWRKAMR